MSRPNPLFHEDDHPFDALQRVGFILAFLRDFHAHNSGEVTFSKRSREGFIFLIGMLEDTTFQISKAVLDMGKEGE
ncbi:MAG: hypothetical protein OEV42_10975 [Deltaproteobacteria bacterium]|nr:hypothetical protein [Deltaproteobacteria bacterium]